MNSGRADAHDADPAAGNDEMNRPFDILFVCTANICRSPVAEKLLLLALGSDADAARFRVTSAGTHGYAGQEMDPPAADELRRLGGDPAGFSSRTLTDPDCAKSDLILTATLEHRSIVLDRVPRALRRTFTILEFSQSLASIADDSDFAAMIARVAADRGSHRFDNYDVADPYGGTMEGHRQAAETIFGAVDVIAARLIASIQPTVRFRTPRSQH